MPCSAMRPSAVDDELDVVGQASGDFGDNVAFEQAGEGLALGRAER